MKTARPFVLVPLSDGRNHKNVPKNNRLTIAGIGRMDEMLRADGLARFRPFVFEFPRQSVRSGQRHLTLHVRGDAVRLVNDAFGTR